MDIRFKQDIYKKYDKWIAQSNGEEKICSSDKDLVDLLSNILKDIGYETMYNSHISSDLDKIGEFKYILGLDLSSFIEFKLQMERNKKNK